MNQYNLEMSIQHHIYTNQVKFGILNKGTDIISEPISILILGIILMVGIFMKMPTELLLIQALVMYRTFPKVLPFIGLLQKLRSQAASLDYCDKLIQDLSSNEEKEEGYIFKNLESVVFVIVFW